MNAAWVPFQDAGGRHRTHVGSEEMAVPLAAVGTVLALEHATEIPKFFSDTALSPFFRRFHLVLRTIGTKSLILSAMQYGNKPSGVFYGWIIVSTAAVGLLLGAFPISVASFGMFFPAYMADFHARRSAIALAFTAHNVVAAFSTFVIGRLADRFGARTVILAGSAALGTVLLSAHAIGSHVWQLYLLYGLLAAAGAATTSVPYALVVSRWFNRHRGLALGLMMIGMGTGAIIVPPIAQRLIVAYGWRNALAAFGCAVLLVPIPIVGLLLKESPEEMGLSPDGATNIAQAELASDGLHWREIWTSRTFWLMTTGFVLVGASVHACIIHLPQLIGDRRGNAGAVALATSVLGLALLIGRAGSGYLLDRHFAPRVASIIFAGAGLGVVLIWISSQRTGLLIGAFLVGLAFGAEADIIAYLVSRYFGLRSLGVAVWFAFGAFVLAGGTGPLLMDFAFDRFGSYTAAFAVAFLLTLLAAGLFTRLGPYRFGVNGEASNVTAYHFEGRIAVIANDGESDHPPELIGDGKPGNCRLAPRRAQRHFRDRGCREGQ